MKELLRDAWHSLRGLRKKPGFVAIVILTLGLGIGANTAIFSVVYGVLLRPLPYSQPDQLVQISVRYNGQLDYSGFSAREFDFWKAHREPFQAIAATTSSGFSLAGGSQPLRVHALRVSSEYFHVMGVQPAIGREFTAEEDSLSGPLVAILSHSLWKTQFGGDAGILGKTILLDGSPYTVIGVMPAAFSDTSNGPTGPGSADLWTTIGQVANTMGGGRNYDVIARLKPGVSREQANAYLEIAKTALFSEGGNEKFFARNHASFTAEPLVSMISFRYHTPLLVLFGAIGFVLLIACANVANLLLARASERNREFAIRTALGAGRRRLIGQLLTESVVLALLGGAAGLLIAYWGLDALLALAPPDLPRVSSIALDKWAFAFTLAISLITGILFGLMPALRGSRVDLNSSLKESSGQASSSLARGRFRSVLAIAEIALSFILLVGAGLLISTFASLLRANPGFDPHSLLSAQIWTTGQKFTPPPNASSSPEKDAGFFKQEDSAAVSRFYQQILDKVSAVPGVQSAAIVGEGLPLERGGNEFAWLPSEGESKGISSDIRTVSLDYFRTLGIRLLQGRLFSSADSPDGAKVAIINQEFVREKFPHQNPIGQSLNEGGSTREIVGVVADVKSFVGDTAPPTMFIPLAQDPGEIQGFQVWIPAYIIVRTAKSPLSLSHAIEAAIQSAHPLVPIGHVESMEQILSSSLSFQKFSMTLMSIFAGLALILAAVGIFGLMSYSVSQRTHEIGIRMALGARQKDVVAMVVRQGMLLACIGLAAGIAGAVAVTRFLASQLYGVQPLDPVIFVIVLVALSLTAFLACYVPARRAARVDPLIALRYE